MASSRGLEGFVHRPPRIFVSSLVDLLEELVQSLAGDSRQAAGEAGHPCKSWKRMPGLMHYGSSGKMPKSNDDFTAHMSRWSAAVADLVALGLLVLELFLAEKRVQSSGC